MLSAVMVTSWSWPRLDGLAGVLDERRDVRPEEVRAVADADHERAVAAGPDDRARHVRVHREQREGALEPVADAAHRLGEVADLVVRPADEVRGDLGVGLAAEHDAGLGQARRAGARSSR
ncbi:hypothetical protein GCM10025868_33400 [Angustibacter aerolatus]|uniref:Uncharacterized protein n=1 Tax=Angustibacter aerolatus TaxID=1162965 RepID=A0ABQ6JMU8_9ACTN|nr:hypothetical protein GCM10025868_33400 [Angustibacter aerolatus]